MESIKMNTIVVDGIALGIEQVVKQLSPVLEKLATNQVRSHAMSAWTDPQDICQQVVIHLLCTVQKDGDRKRWTLDSLVRLASRITKDEVAREARFMHAAMRDVRRTVDMDDADTRNRPGSDATPSENVIAD
jgi:hypothetical protein